MVCNFASLQTPLNSGLRALHTLLLVWKTQHSDCALAGLLHGRDEGYRLRGVRGRADRGGCAAGAGPHVSGGPRGKSGEAMALHMQPQP
jgi:hypothetical protein